MAVILLGVRGSCPSWLFFRNGMEAFLRSGRIFNDEGHAAFIPRLLEP